MRFGAVYGLVWYRPNGTTQEWRLGLKTKPSGQLVHYRASNENI